MKEILMIFLLGGKLIRETDKFKTYLIRGEIPASVNIYGTTTWNQFAYNLELKILLSNIIRHFLYIYNTILPPLPVKWKKGLIRALFILLVL